MDELYRTLQVDPSADLDVIEAAYRTLARKYHPDVYKEADAHRRMQALNDAYAVLRDPEQRAAFDRKRSRTSVPASPATAGPSDSAVPEPGAPAGPQMTRARERARRQKIAELNDSIQQHQSEMDRDLLERRRHRARIGVVYLAGALLITLTTVLTGGAGSYLTSREFYIMLAVAILIALVGIFLIARTVFASRRRRMRILRLRTLIRQRRQELSRR